MLVRRYPGAPTPLAAALAVLSIPACASAPEPAAPTAPPGDDPGDQAVIVTRDGRPETVVTHDVDGRHAFATDDGGRNWREVPVPALDPGRKSEEWQVSRDYDSDRPWGGAWRLWQAQGLTWQLVATLPSSTAPAPGTTPAPGAAPAPVASRAPSSVEASASPLDSIRDDLGR